MACRDARILPPREVFHDAAAGLPATLPTSGVLTLAAQGLVTCAVGAASRVAVVNQPVIAGVLALPRAAAVAGIVAAVRRKLRGEPGGVTP